MKIIYEMHLLWLEYFSPKFKTTGNPESSPFSSRACARPCNFSLCLSFALKNPLQKKNAKVGKREKKSQESRSNKVVVTS